MNIGMTGYVPWWWCAVTLIIGANIGLVIFAIIFTAKEPKGGQIDGAKMVRELRMKNGAVIKFKEGPKYQSLHDGIGECE